MRLSPEQASEFFSEHYGKMFFPSLVSYMSSDVIMAMVLAKEGALAAWRELMGPANSLTAKMIAPNR